MTTPTSVAATPGTGIGALYRRSVLDPLIELARVIAHDFVKRPRHYRKASARTAELLAGHRIATGSSAAWPSAMQRANLYGGVFGGGFCGFSIGLRMAALAHVQAAGQGAATLVAVGEAAQALRDSLKSLEGRVLDTIADETEASFASAVEVFRDEAVARVFGLDPVTGADWPLQAGDKPESAADAAYLVEEVQRSLAIVQVRPAMTQRRFMLLQRVARSGGAALDLLLDGDAEQDDKQLETLVGHAYAWEMALQELATRIDPVQVWKDPDYRLGCSPCERAMVEDHPSGEIDLSGTQLDPAMARLRIGGFGFSTMTNFGICCCTGDLPCPQASEGSDYCCPTNTGFTCPTSDCGTCTA